MGMCHKCHGFSYFFFLVLPLRVFPCTRSPLGTYYYNKLEKRYGNCGNFNGDGVLIVAHTGGTHKAQTRKMWHSQ